ncbi:MAG: hypothetical protein K8W52_39100 [Deltaproteobacteria bacterium]|nr:hypothetical protein [Deltaproteobacteria bacterium]
MRPSLFVLAFVPLAACSGAPESLVDGGGPEPTPGEVAPPEAIIAPPVAPPPGLPDAPAMVGDIRYVPGRDSAMVFVPVVPGVRDYRIYAVAPGVTVHAVDGGTQVDGATLFCAGLRQHNQCDDSEAYDFGPGFTVDHCAADVRAVDVPKEVLRIVQVDGLRDASDVIVEAIDAQCPFPGAEGPRHADIDCVFDGAPTATAVVDGHAVTWEHCPATFPIRTTDEIRAQYGSAIVNGQGPVPIAPGTSPTKSVGLPAPAIPPRVLARAVVRLTPTGTATRPAGFTFWEDFADDSDQPAPVITSGDGTLVPKDYPVWGMHLSQTKTLNIYDHSGDASQTMITRGTLRSVFADAGQGIMASNLLVPRQAFAIPEAADRFVHVTFEVPTDATLRRYWTFVTCGSETPGKTIGSGPGFPADGALATASALVFGPGFMEPDDGGPLSTAGWNCLVLVPRNGSYYELEGTGPYPRPETDIRVAIDRALPGYDPKTYLQTARPVTVVSPDMNSFGAFSWIRTWNDQHQPDGVMLDDQMFIEQRTRLDVFFNRGRIVVYANGAQKICNDLGSARLTMAEAAVGIGHVHYHSSAEQGDMTRPDWLTTGQYQYRKNTPFLDQRGFDNYGVQPDATLPASFQEGPCYAAP